MHRRSVLRTIGSSVTLASVGVVGGHSTDAGGTSPAVTQASEPVGTVSVENTREAVLGREEATAYVATVDGFAVVDISDPASMTVLTERAVMADHEDGPLGGIWDLYYDDDRLLVAGPAHGGRSLRGFEFFDVSDPSAPESIASHETEFHTHNCVLDGAIGYFTGSGIEGSPMVVVNLESGEELARWSVRDADERWAELPFGVVNLHDVWVADGLAYLAYWDAGTWCLDVSDPRDPTLVSRVRGRPVEQLVTIAEQRGEATELPGNDHFVTVDESGDLLGIGAESWAVDAASEDGPGGIAFYDVSDPTDPTPLGEIEAPPTPDPSRGGVWTTAHNFDLVAGRCYASWYQGGVTVHDVTDPTDPVERYRWRDSDRGKFWTAQLAVPGEYFVASSIGTFGSNTGADDDSLVSGLLAFPDPSSAATTTPATLSPTRTGASDETTTDEGTTPTERSEGSPTGGEASPTSGTGAGAGLATGLAGLAGLGAWYRRRQS